jgi:putative membrane protein
MHVVGAHYTYSAVPYDRALASALGVSLDALMGWERNQYDRVVHLGYGLLLSLPFMEVLRRLGQRRLLGASVVMVVMSTSLLYELIEWGAMLAFGADQGMAFLGAQGDPWDAHKDMLLATLGSVVSVALAALRGFAGRRGISVFTCFNSRVGSFK